MDDATFARLTAHVLNGHRVDWDAIETGGAEHARARIQALRIVAAVAAASRDAEPRPRERWGGFELIEPVGYGGYGEVWRAIDLHLEREVALKLLPAVDDHEAQAVLSEGRLLARVRHPNVAAIYGVSRINGEIGVAMEFIDGDDLAAIVRRDGPLAGSEVLDIGLQVTRALDAVHRAGVLHRDIKASNVKRGLDGRVILLDFGSSRELLVHSKESLHEAGTPLYLAPEVLRGERATIQSDLYSVGVLLYYLATGRYPVAAQSLAELRDAHEARATSGSSPPGAQHLPPVLAEVLRDTLSMDPARRPPSAADVAARLARKPRRVMTLLSAAGAIVVAVVIMVLLQHSKQPPVAPAGTSARRLEWSIPPATIGQPSRDGRMLPFTDRRNGALSILRIDSGAIEMLTPLSETSNYYAGSSAASDDGSRVAYAWHGLAEGTTELRVIATGSGTTAMLWRESKGAEIQPAAWSRDGRQIAGVLRHPSGETDVFIISPGAAARIIATKASAPSFSDDGHFLAFQRTDAASGKSVVWIADLQSGAVTALRTGDNDEAPIWVGGTIVFISERSGTRTLWAVKIRDPRTGTIDGSPRPLSGSGEVSVLLGATADGSIIYRRIEGSSNIVVSALDGSTPQQISSGAGTHVSPDWSTDGQRIAWIQEAPVGPLRHHLRVRDLRTGRDDTFTTLGASFGGPAQIGPNPRLSPDGTRVLLRSIFGVRGFFIADLDTGHESRRYLEQRNYADVEWDDESHVFVLERDRGIFRMDLATGMEERLYALPPGLRMGRGIAVTPDRKRIAFVLTEDGRQEKATIMAVARDGTMPQVLFSRSHPAPPRGLPLFAAVPLLLGEWTRDGRALLFAATDVLPSGFVRWNTELWALPAEGGPPGRTGLAAPGLRDIRSDPSGRRVVYCSFAEHAETWLLRGALADATPRR